MAQKCANCGKVLEAGCLCSGGRGVSTDAYKFLEKQAGIKKPYIRLCDSCYERFNTMYRAQTGHERL